MNLANQLTLGRICLIPVLLICISYYDSSKPLLRWIAVMLFSIASISDAVDGYIARVKNMKTPIGSFLDPFADKLLLVSTFLALTFSETLGSLIPKWVLIVLLLREVVIIAGFLILRFNMGESFTVCPRPLGKVATFLQMLSVVFLLIGFPWISQFWIFTAFVTIISTVDYILRESKKLNTLSPT